MLTEIFQELVRGSVLQELVRGPVLQELVLQASTWFINILFWASFFPQILLNYRLKSTKGMSDLMLLSFFYGYITYTYYVLCLQLPVAYKVLAPISCLTVLFMIMQRFMYDDGLRRDRSLLALYVISSIAAIMLIPYALSQTAFVGNVTGWISATIWFILPLPQAVKILRERSVFGFSFLLVSLVGFADFLQAMIGISYRLPSQTIVNGLRGFAVYIIYCGLFWYFKGKGRGA